MLPEAKGRGGRVCQSESVNPIAIDPSCSTCNIVQHRATSCNMMSDEHIKFLNCTDMTDKWPTYSDVSDVKFSLKWKVQIRQGDPCLESLVSTVLWLMASSSPPASWNSSWPVMPSSWPCKKQHVFSIVHRCASFCSVVHWFIPEMQKDSQDMFVLQSLDTVGSEGWGYHCQFLPVTNHYRS